MLRIIQSYELVTLVINSEAVIRWRSVKEKGVLKNFAKFTEKNLSQSFLFSCRKTPIL